MSKAYPSILIFISILSLFCVSNCGNTHIQNSITQPNSLANGHKKAILHVPSIKCGGCASAIRSLLKNNSHVKNVVIDVQAKKVSVEYDANGFSAQDIAKMLEAPYGKTTIESVQ